MRPCQSCTLRGIRCHFNPRMSDRCAECLQNGRRCNLASNKAEWESAIRALNKLEEELDEVDAKRHEMDAKRLRLRKMIRLKEKKIAEMGLEESKNIEELEELERREEIPSGQTPFVFDAASFDQILNDRPDPLAPTSGGNEPVVAEASSSQGS